ncbi:GNAT family N-acetyltransferase [Mucilaginibacter sp.]|uniref:GNAT family N-acetyltransferase n=1 Tax=Mucilaginibacter sp. TaxID=1882438 RepID=UPI003D0FBDAC
MNAIVDTPRLIVRLFKAGEEEIYLSLFEDKRVLLYIPDRGREEHITIFRHHLAEVPGSVMGRWGIFNKTDGDFIGMCLLRHFDDGTDSIELGYVLHHNYWGKGIASEMAAALLAWAANIAPDAEFVAVTDLANLPSQRVLEKVGMQRERNYFRHDEELAFFRLKK